MINYILNQSPFLRIVVFYILGIIVQYHTDVSSYVVAGMLAGMLLLIASFFPFYYKQYVFRWIFGAGLYCLVFFAASGFTRAELLASVWTSEEGMRRYLVRVEDDPVRKPKSRMFKVRILSGDREESCRGKQAILYVVNDSANVPIFAGDCLEIRTVLRKQGIAATGTVFPGGWKKTEQAYSFKETIRFRSLDFRRLLIGKLRELLPDDKERSVVSAIVLGYRGELDPELRQSFTRTGTSHILAVSGMHTAILAGYLYFFFSFLGNGRWTRCFRLFLILALMWMFAFLTGLPPSVVRAVSMLSVVGVGDAFQMKAFSLNTVAASAFLMLFYNPLYLLDVGFQLSFIAVLGILWINPLLSSLVQVENRIVYYFWQLSSVSVSAQLATGPLTIYYFHQFPFAFLLSSCLAVPLAGLLLAVVPFLLLLSFLPIRLSLLSSLLHPLALVFVDGIEGIGELPFSSLTDLHPTIGDVCMLYLGFLLLLAAWRNKRFLYICLLGILVLFPVFYYL